MGRLLTSNTQCTMNLCTKATIECCMLQSHIYPIPISTTDKHMSTSLACTSSTVVVWQHQWLLDWCFVSNHNCLHNAISVRTLHLGSLYSISYATTTFWTLNCSPGQNLLVESAHNRLKNHVPLGHNTLADSVPPPAENIPSTHIHACTHKYTRIHSCTHTHTHMHTYAHHTYRYTHIHTCTCTLSHAYTSSLT